MRYINWESPDIPKSWLKSSKTALNTARSKAGKERKDYIRDRRLWADNRIKSLMAKISDDKCWYCETKEIRSDNPVDHFRPKGEVTECEDHKGYWWLAFDWKNFRFACTYCNTGHADEEEGETLGKDTYFPLRDESKRSMDEVCAYSIEDEEPILLDPTVEADTKLIWFDDDGRVVPRSKRDPHAIRRVEKSRDVYHLDAPATKNARRKIYNKIKHKVNLGKKWDAKIQRGFETETSTEALDEVIKDLREMRMPDVAFSTVADAYLLGFYDDDAEWISEVWEPEKTESEEPREVQSE